MKLLIAFSLALAALVGSTFAKNIAEEKVIYCYFESWTVYRPDNGKFDVDNIDPNLCTHVVFTFLGLNEDGTLHILDAWESNPDGLDGFRRIVALKEKNANLHVMIALGGWNEGSTVYSEVAADPARRAVLVRSVVEFLDRYGFDGLDFDWEYPAKREATPNPADKDDFVLMMRDLKAAFEPKGYVLSAAVNCAKRNVDASYDVRALSEALDYFNIMCYDFHGSFDSYVGHHSPLYGASVDALYDNSDWNIDTGIQYWLEAGADPAKINFGLATYARTFTLAHPVVNTSLYAPTEGGGVAGPYTRLYGVLGYNEICEAYPDAVDIWDNEQQVPHLVIGDQWIGYENRKSLGVKIDYALKNKLGGFMVWSLDTDDFRGVCGNGTYPLINTIHIKLNEHGYKLKTN